MKQGHIFLVLGLEGNWPPPERKVMVTSQQDLSLVTLFALADGCLEFVVEESGLSIIRHITKPIRFEGYGMFVFDAGWNNGYADLRINGQTLPALIEMTQPFVIKLQKSEVPIINSLTHPEATSACEKWIVWRKNRYAKAKVIDSEYLRAKSFSEQTSELEQAIFGLDYLLDEFSNNNEFLIVHIATTLRALIYWEDGKGSKYNPLLFRIAGRLDPPLPLPVFAFTELSIEPPQIIREAQYRTENSFISLQQEFPMQKLVDIQDVLDSAVQTERLDSKSLKLNKKPQILRGRDLIREFASTAATGHYHEHIKRDFDRIHYMEAFDLPLSYRFILRIGQITSSLGKFVLGNLPPHK